MTTADVIIIGGGIAGAGCAAMLSQNRASVVLLEREETCGYHSTGRSAAMFFRSYGKPQIRALTRASAPFLLETPEGFSEAPLTEPRGALMTAAPGEDEALADAVANSDGLFALVSPDEAAEIVPILRKERVIGGAWEADARDIDVDALHQGWLRQIRSKGRIVCDAEVTGLSHGAGVWSVQTSGGSFSAPVVVNAAGAWCDAVAEMAGARPIGLQPARRSAALLPAPEGVDLARVPLFGDLAETYYSRPQSGMLMVSPADETPVDPHDAFADDMDLAEGLHHFEQATTVAVTRVAHNWAGLRTFAPDRVTVCGFAPDADGFFWLAGQGGYGIQTAPAMSMLAAALIGGEACPESLLAEGVDPAALSPARFQT